MRYGWDITLLRCAAGLDTGAGHGGEMSQPRACSGKCMGGGSCQSSKPKVWTIAACDGMVSLFSEGDDGAYHLISQRGSAVASSIEALRDTLEDAAQLHAFDRLIIVGGKGDVAWVELALTANLAKRVMAQINYPLLAGWFKESEPLHSLSSALMQVLKR